MKDSRLGPVSGRDNNIVIQANSWSKQLFATAANNWSTILLLQQTSVANKWSTILLLLLPLQQTIAAQRKKKKKKQLQHLDYNTAAVQNKCSNWSTVHYSKFWSS